MIKRIFTDIPEIQENITGIFNNQCNTVCNFQHPVLKMSLRMEDGDEIGPILGIWYNVSGISLVFDQTNPEIRCEVAVATEGHSINTKVPKSYFGHCIECQLIVDTEHVEARIRKTHLITDDEEYIPVVGK